MTTAIEELRPLSAGRLLRIRRAVQMEGVEEWAVPLVCNARVLAECCYTAGEQVFPHGEAVLESLTVREMESLIRQLSGDETPRTGVENPGFDPARFRALKEA